MLELKVKAGRSHVSLYDLPARLGRHEALREIGDAVEGLIAYLDDLWGDPDLEDNDDREADMSDWEPDDDARGDTSWTEWHTRGRHKDDPGLWTRDGRQLLEDMEEDDGDTCLAAEECGTAGGRWFDRDGYPGDAADTELNGDEHDYSNGLP